MYDWLTLNSPADLAGLEALIPVEYEPKRVAQKLATGLSPAVKGVLVEHYYSDKDYRSTFYHFYAKKGQQYRPDCVRLHFFDAAVQFDQAQLRLTTRDRELSDPNRELSLHYFGFMVLRPTGIVTIGRTVVSPDVRNGAAPFIITAHHKAHLLGYRLTVQGFPSMDQHHDISVCAHAACWSILRHYSERYSTYREYLTQDITLMAQEFNPGGLVPSKGLQVSHAERVFQEAGTFPVYVAREPDDPDPAFYRQLGAYLDSGFPLFAALPSVRHAVAVVGYEWKPGATGGDGLRFAWDQTRALAVVDDNHLPYLTVAADGDAVGGDGVPDYTAQDIEAFIVPLPEKVFYPAEAVDALAPKLFKLGAGMGLPEPEHAVIRYFITTGSAFRRFIREYESEYDSRLVQAIMTLPFAQFVWVVEFSTLGQWEAGRVAGRAIVDATASLREVMPLWLLHSVTDALVFERATVPNLEAGELALKTSVQTGFSRMGQNLRRTSVR